LVAVVLKVLLVNLLAALNFANVFLYKNVKKTLKKRDQNTKRKNFFYIYGVNTSDALDVQSETV